MMLKSNLSRSLRTVVVALSLMSTGAVCTVALAADAPGVVAPVSWTTSISDALRASQHQGKDTLVWFSGSGWNTVSDAVEPFLMDQGFVESLSGKYVLVRADFPRAATGQSEVDPQYAQWAERLNVSSLPAIVVLDSRGVPYAEISDRAIEPASYLRSVQSLVQKKADRDAAFIRASKLTGVERARALDEGMTFVAPFAGGWYDEVMLSIVECDTDNSAGLKQKYQPLVSQAMIDKVIQHEVYPMLDRSEFAGVIDRLSKLIDDVHPSVEQKQLLIAFKAQVAYSNKDTPLALKWLNEAQALDPSSKAVARIVKAKEQILEGTPPAE